MKYKIFFLIFLISGFFYATAQVSDAGLWLSLNAEKKITPVLSLNLAQEFRFNENITELGTFLSEAGLTYKINKVIRISGNYRFTNKRRLDDSYSKRHRYYFDLSMRKKLSSVIFILRTRFQSQYADVYSSQDGTVPSNYSRNKLTFRFDSGKKYSPYISTELFTPLNKSGAFYINNARYCAGIVYDINRMHAIDVFYMIQQQYNTIDPRKDFIIGISYNFTFR
ncbi:MAG: DUF2490 domain-containing protein [Bacteroidales bacterium]